MNNNVNLMAILNIFDDLESSYIKNGSGSRMDYICMLLGFYEKKGKKYTNYNYLISCMEEEMFGYTDEDRELYEGLKKTLTVIDKKICSDGIEEISDLNDFLGRCCIEGDKVSDSLVKVLEDSFFDYISYLKCKKPSQDKSDVLDAKTMMNMFSTFGNTFTVKDGKPVGHILNDSDCFVLTNLDDVVQLQSARKRSFKSRVLQAVLEIDSKVGVPLNAVFLNRKLLKKKNDKLEFKLGDFKQLISENEVENLDTENCCLSTIKLPLTDVVCVFV